MNERHFVCSDCKHEWAVPHGTGRPQSCPQCRGANLHRSPTERGCGGGRSGFRRGAQS